MKPITSDELNSGPPTGTFGNTVADLKRVSVFGFLIALVAGVVAGVVAHANGRLHSNWQFVVVAPLCIGAILPLVVFPTCLFSIQIDGDQIAHVFCRRVVLSRKSLSDVITVDVGRSLFGVVFRFKDGSAIRFLGAHLRIIDAMCVLIHRRRPDFVRFRLGQRAGRMLTAIKLLNPGGH